MGRRAKGLKGQKKEAICHSCSHIFIFFFLICRKKRNLPVKVWQSPDESHLSRHTLLVGGLNWEADRIQCGLHLHFHRTRNRKQFPEAPVEFGASWNPICIEPCRSRRPTWGKDHTEKFLKTVEHRCFLATETICHQAHLFLRAARLRHATDENIMFTGNAENLWLLLYNSFFCLSYHIIQN